MDTNALFEKYSLAQHELNMLTKNRSKLQGLQFNSSPQLGKLNDEVFSLLERIYLYDDDAARRRLRQVNDEIANLKQLLKSIPHLMNLADAKISTVKDEVETLTKQIAATESVKAHWQRERNRLITKIQNSPLRSDELNERLAIVEEKIRNS